MSAPPKPYRLAILACGRSKLDRAAPAEELYTGALFRASLAAARKLADRFVILSAKHGVLSPETVTEPYEQSIAAMHKLAREQWGALAAKGLQAALGYSSTHVANPRVREVLCLAPASYVELVSIYGKREWVMPLKGLGIGHQKAALRQLAEGA